MTVQVPWHRTLQLSTLRQLTTEPSPISAAQVGVLVQLYSLLFPVSTLQIPETELHAA